MQQGFTLVELLVVMSIIGILMGLIVGVAGYASKKTAASQAQSDLSKLFNALDQYRSVYGSYPYLGTDTYNDERQIQDLGTAVIGSITNVPGEIQANEFPLLDPWGNPYMYRATRRNANTPAYQIELWSEGSDTADDSDNVYVKQQ